MKELTELNENFDFGFSALSEEELKETEKQLQHAIKTQTSELKEASEQVKIIDKKLKGIKDMIMPLLNNLMANPEKEYIYWPNRTEKIQQFIQRLDKYIND